jgi:hypothetical protein
VTSSLSATASNARASRVQENARLSVGHLEALLERLLQYGQSANLDRTLVPGYPQADLPTASGNRGGRPGSLRNDLGLGFDPARVEVL